MFEHTSTYYIVLNRVRPVGVQKLGKGVAPEFEAERIAGVEYEEIEKLGEHSETREQPHPPTGDYELTQCAAYEPVNGDNI